MLFDIFIDNEEGKEDRSHQDNFYSISAYNNEYQYCSICGRYERFEYDRCCSCKNN